MVLLPGSGKVLSFANGAAAVVWDPKTGTFNSVPSGGTNVFCAGHAVMPDGKVLVVGGLSQNEGTGPGTVGVNVFDPFTEKWTPAANMTYRRWYPTATTLPNGKVLATSGDDVCLECAVPIPEVYDPVANTWTQLPGASADIPDYPFMFVLPDGRLLQAGANQVPTTTQVLDLATQTWTTVDSRVLDGGSAVMYQPGKVLKAGSAADEGDPADPSAATAYTLDMTQPAPSWQPTGSMAFGRAFLNLTSLADGTVLATGGSTTRDGLTYANSVLNAELWSPSSGTWSTMAAMQTPRLYHSTALLLTDGRVLVSGGGEDGASDMLNAEIYSPPYLFKGARPTITNAPTNIDYGSSFVVQTPDAANISSVSLVRTGAVTHAFNQSQRFMNLTFQKGSGSLTIDAPANANLAPPGYYLLFIINSNGVPSVAPFVKLPVPQGPPPPPPPPPGAGLVGDKNVETTADSNPVGVAEAYPSNSASGGPVDTLHAYLDATNTASNVALGLYRDSGSGHPGSLLGSCTIVFPLAGAWNTCTLSPAVSINASTTYWTAILQPTTATGTLKYRNGGRIGSESDPVNRSSFAATWPPGNTHSDGPASLYADLAGPPPPDLTAPTLNLPADITTTATSGSGATVSYSVSATDPDNTPAQLTISCVPPSGSTFPIATTTVNCTASDPAGNSSSGSFKVTVNPQPPVDLTPPTLTLPANITTTATSGSGATVTYSVSATDPDNTPAQLTISCVPPSGSTFPIGTTTVNCTASDPAGNSTSGSFTVTINPQPPPSSAGFVGTQTVYPSADWSPAGKADAWKSSASASGAVDTLHAYLDATNTATNVRLALYSDNAGKPGTLLGSCSLSSPKSGTGNACSVTAVTVTAGQAYWFAVLSPSGSSGKLVTRDSGSSGSAPAVNNTGSISAFPTTWAVGSTFPGGSPASFYADLAGPPPPDLTAPTLNLPADITTTATSSSGATVTYSVSATDPDNTPAQLTISCVPSSGSTFPIATTTVNCTASDPAGNSSSGSFKVTVNPQPPPPPVDLTPPTLTLPANITTTATSGSGATVTYSVSATDPDNTPAQLTISCVPPSGSTFPIATTTVNCTASDPAANSSTGSFTVTVNPQPPPTGALVGIKTVLTSVDTNKAGSLEAYRTSATASGAVTTLHLYVDAGNTATSILVGLYSDGGTKPANLMGSCTITSPVAGWNSCSIFSVSVTNGTLYWLAALPPSTQAGSLKYRISKSGTGPAVTASGTFGSLPSSNWTIGSTYPGDAPMSAYAD